MADPSPPLVSVYVTASGPEAAERLARALVEERLAACVNVLPGVRSFYRWEGELHVDDEVALLAKTRADRFDALAARVRELHGYDVPCVVALGIADALPDYQAWVAEEATPAP